MDGSTRPRWYPRTSKLRCGRARARHDSNPQFPGVNLISLGLGYFRILDIDIIDFAQSPPSRTATGTTCATLLTVEISDTFVIGTSITEARGIAGFCFSTLSCYMVYGSGFIKRRYLQRELQHRRPFEPRRGRKRGAA